MFFVKTELRFTGQIMQRPADSINTLNRTRQSSIEDLKNQHIRSRWKLIQEQIEIHFKSIGLRELLFMNRENMEQWQTVSEIGVLSKLIRDLVNNSSKKSRTIYHKPFSQASPTLVKVKMHDLTKNKTVNP